MDPRRQRSRSQRGVGAIIARLHRRALSPGRLSGPLLHRLGAAVLRAGVPDEVRERLRRVRLPVAVDSVAEAVAVATLAGHVVGVDQEQPVAVECGLGGLQLGDQF